MCIGLTGNRVTVKCTYVVNAAGDNLSAVARECDADTSRPQDVHEVVRQTNRTPRPDSIPAVLRRYRLHRLITTAGAAVQRLQVHTFLLDRRRLRDRTAGQETSGRSDLREYGETLYVEGRRGTETIRELQRTAEILLRTHQTRGQVLEAVDHHD